MIGKPDISAAETFLNEISWMFQINGYDKDFVLADNDEENKLAEITVDVSYQRIELKLFPAFFKNNIHEQRRTLLHELCHTITAPSKLALCDLLNGKLITQHRIEQINEESTSRIESIIHNLMTGNLTYAKQAYSNYLKPKKKGKKRG